jgi:hypothetical protein
MGWHVSSLRGRWLGLVLLTLLAVVASGCDLGSSSSGSSGGGGINIGQKNIDKVCPLVSNDQANSAAASTFSASPKDDKESTGSPRCKYENDTAAVTVVIDTDETGVAASKAVYAGSGSQSVSNVGDEAAFDTSVDALWVRKGKNRAITITILNPSTDSPTKKSAAIALANRILSQI